MTYRLKPDESSRDGVVRIAGRELAKAREQLRSRGRKGEEESGDEAVHEVRKGLKRVRALLRLVRDELGDPVYHRENLALRDAARPLAELRDAAVLVETLDAVARGARGGLAPSELNGLRDGLLRNHQEVGRRVLVEESAFAVVSGALDRSLARLPGWPIERDGWPTLAGGLRRVYRTGRRALAAVLAEPTVESFHEWRKQAKYLWHVLQLIEDLRSSTAPGMVGQVRKLTRLLGDEHDLTLLRRRIGTHPALAGIPRPSILVALIDRRRLLLRTQALALGGELYRDRPKVFVDRFEAPRLMPRSPTALAPRATDRAARLHSSRGP
jgi:CHAD domain-containing protein